MKMFLVFGDMAALENYAIDIRLLYITANEEKAQKKIAVLISKQKEELANRYSQEMKDILEKDLSNGDRIKEIDRINEDYELKVGIIEDNMFRYDEADTDTDINIECSGYIC